MSSDGYVSPARQALLAAAIVAVTLIVYLPALEGGLVWDDNPLAIENPVIKADDGLRRIWFTTEPIEYLPLSYSTYWIEWRLLGSDALGHHLVNVLLHAGGGRCCFGGCCCG